MGLSVEMILITNPSPIGNYCFNIFKMFKI